MAKGPGGKSAGRVSVRVVPDSTRFNADLKKSLERIEKRTVLNIPMAVETRQAEVDLKKFQKKWNGEQVSFDVDAKTAGATAHMREFTRRRSVDVDVNVSKKSLAKAATLIASLSGARVTGDLVKNISTQLQNLDRALPKIALVMAAIGSIGSLALSSVGGIVTLGASITALAGLAGVLPGIFGGMAAGLGVLVIALADAGNRLSSLSSIWTETKTIIQDNFWAEAQKPIIAFVQSTMFGLRDELKLTSKSLGSWAASVANGFQAAFAGGALSKMFSNLRQSIDIAATGTGAFASALTTLGVVGSNYLPRLATAFSDVTSRFDAWLSQVAGDGTLDRWIENGITVAKQLGSVIGSVASIFSGLFQAAQASGGGGLASFADVLARVAEVVNSPAFQGTLTAFFSAAAAGVSGLASALGPIGNMLTALAPTLTALLSSIGVTVGTVMSQIATALSDPEFGAGLLALFQGIREGLAGIAPALPAVAQALGTVGQFAGALAAQLGPILGATLTALAPVVSGVLQALQPLIPILGGVLVQAIQLASPLLQALVPIIGAIAPALGTAAQAFMPFLQAILPPLTQLMSGLVPVISGVLAAIVPLIPPILQLAQAALVPLIAVVQALLPIFQPMVDLLTGILLPVIQTLTPVVSMLAQVFLQIAQALAPIIATVLPPLMGLFTALMPLVTQLVAVVMQLVQPFLALLTPLLQLIGPILGPLIDFLTILVNLAVSALVPALKLTGAIFGGVASAIGDILLPVMKTITDVLGGLITFLTGVFTGNWKQAWDGIVQIFSGIWNGMLGFIKGVINGIVDLINGMIGGVNDITGAIGIPKIPKIPHLAEGADVMPSQGGTVVRLAEAGRPETVTDYGRTNKLIALSNALAQQALKRASGETGGNVFNINEVSDPVGTALAVARRQQALGV